MKGNLSNFRKKAMNKVTETVGQYRLAVEFVLGPVRINLTPVKVEEQNKNEIVQNNNEKKSENKGLEEIETEELEV